MCMIYLHVHTVTRMQETYNSVLNLTFHIPASVSKTILIEMSVRLLIRNSIVSYGASLSFIYHRRSETIICLLERKPWFLTIPRLGVILSLFTLKWMGADSNETFYKSSVLYVCGYSFFTTFIRPI